MGQLQQLLLAPAISSRLHMIEVSLRIKPILGNSEADFTELQIRSVPQVSLMASLCSVLENMFYLKVAV